MLLGLATVSCYADDVPAAARWYGRLLGVEPYFARPVDGPPAYVEFRVGPDQDELGIVDRRWSPHGPDAATGPAGTIVYWHVDDLAATLARLAELGATPHQPPTDRGAGFVTASVVDPFGNVLGVMHNPHHAALHA